MSDTDPIITKTGKHLSDEDVEALAEEAEGTDYLTKGAGAPPTEAEAEFLRNQDLPTALIKQPEGLEDVELTDCDISFLINIRGVTSLLEAVDIAAANLGRYGMDSFYILATEPSTGRQWILSNGELQEADEVIQRLEELQADDSD